MKFVSTCHLSYIFGIAVMMLASGFILNVPIATSAQNEIVFPLGSKPYGMTYGDWSAKWWQWALSIPKDVNPGGDTTGKYCGKNQSGPVWFLAGTFGGSVERTCTIPFGKAIMFPPLNSECSYAEFPGLKTESELLQCAKSFQDQTTAVDVTIDGKKIQDLETFRVQSPLLNVTFPENNVFGIPAGPSQAVSDGIWIILKPLPKGDHTLNFKGTSVDYTVNPVNTFVSDATYRLVVK